MATTIKTGQQEAGWDVDVRISGEYEGKFSELLGSTKYEIKTDFWTSKSGNVCIEMFGRDGRRTGLNATQSEFWVAQLVDENGVDIAMTFIIDTARLWNIVERWRKLKGEKSWLVPMGDDDASLGAMIPFELFLPGANWEEERMKEIMEVES